MAHKPVNINLSDNEIDNLVRVLGAASGGFKQLAREHEHPNGLHAEWLKNYAQAADELIETVAKQHNANVK